MQRNTTIPCLSRENSSWVNPAFMKKLIRACLPTTSDTNLEKLHYVLLHVHSTCTANKSSCLHVPPNKGMKNGRAQDTLIYMMFRRRSEMSPRNSPKWLMSNHQTSSNLPKILPKAPPANSALPTPGGRKSASRWRIYLSEAVECRGTFRTEEPLTLRPRPPPRPPKTYIPSATSLQTDVCTARGAGAVPLGDSWLQRLAWRKWPTCFDVCPKSNHDSRWPLGRNLPRFWSLGWVMGWDAITTTKA